MPRTRLKMDLEKAIAIGDSKRVRSGLDPVKSKKKLAELLFSEEDVRKQNLSESSVYWKIYRCQKDGFYFRNELLIEAICDILQIKENQLIKKF